MTGRIALITGASRGLGRSIALHLARGGTHVIGTYLNRRADADSVVAEIEAAGSTAVMLPLDVGDSATFQAFAATIGDVLRTSFGRERFDVLVNNAGAGIHAPFAATTEAQFDELFRIHVKAPFFLTQALLPLLADGGRILNVSTGLARFTMPGYAAYASAKGAVEVLTRYMAKELGTRGIRVNVVAPGAIESDFGGGRRPRQPGSEPPHRQHDSPRTRRPARRHRPRRGGHPLGRLRVGQRHAHRAVGRTEPLAIRGASLTSRRLELAD